MPRDLTPPTTPPYRLTHDGSFACSNIHNVDAAPGQAGVETRVPRIQPGERYVIADLEGPAVVTRLWLTFDWPNRFHHHNAMLRNRMVSLEITWDGADRPAVAAPIGDFFNHPLGYDIPFESAWFADPVGRASICLIPMPFRERATFAIVNDFDQPVTVFHDIRLLTGVEPHADDGYLHACFRRTIPDAPGPTHDVLPRVRGVGRLLGVHLGIIADRFNPMDWHGGNMALYLDGDEAHPSMLGPSLDDYAGSAWLMEKTYAHQDSGLILSRVLPNGGGHYGMYVHHRRDPIPFASSCAVSLRPAVHVSASELLGWLRQHPGLAERLAIPYEIPALEQLVRAGDNSYFNCGRRDDLSTVALYYLDSPDGQHDPVPPELRRAPGWRWPETNPAPPFDVTPL